MITVKEVKRYEATDYEHVLDFIKRVTTLETVNNEIIEQSILIKESDKVAGMVSFEAFDQIGMIRYFIYFLNYIDVRRRKRLISLSRLLHIHMRVNYLNC